MEDNYRSGPEEPAPVPSPSASRKARIIVLEGDETGQELLEQSLRVLDPSVIRLNLELEHYDLSLQNRRRTGNEVVEAAAQALKEARFGLKAATVTP
jgi:isocitrate dehydrogenase (NAD+)